MARKNIRSDKDTIYHDFILRQDGADVSHLRTTGHIKGELPAQNVWSLTGRGCPKDAGQIAFFEVNEDTGIQWFYCKSCGTRYTETELNSDALYRKIPQDVILRYVEDMQRKGR